MNGGPPAEPSWRTVVAQFALLVGVNALVGATLGLERSLLPAVAEQEFGLVARTATLSFVVVFGLAKALTNLLAGRLSDRVGRKPVLVAGWLAALPVPFLLAFAPSWGWVLAANALLGIGQGLAWTTTVVMKIDLVGPSRRGLAMGLNEFAGYLAVAGSAALTTRIAAATHLRPEPFLLGAVPVVAGLLASLLLVRETGRPASAAPAPADAGPAPSLFAFHQAGWVNNLNDGVAWGLFPLLEARAGLDLASVGSLAALYPAVWGATQVLTGPWSDRVGRAPLIAWGMAVQAAGIAVVLASSTFGGFAAGHTLLGLGTAMAYPTLLAAVADAAHPSRRASAVGVYRLWRDLGYGVGALLAGVAADLLGVPVAVGGVAALTLASGLVVAARRERDPGVGVERDPGSTNAAARGGARRDRVARGVAGDRPPGAGVAGDGDPVPHPPR